MSVLDDLVADLVTAVDELTAANATAQTRLDTAVTDAEAAAAASQERWKGPYDAGDAYDELDIVSFEGSSYIATGAIAIGVEPPDGAWELLAEGYPGVVTKADVGLGNADNTSDANKPVSTAQQTALDQKENIGAYTAGVNSQTETAYTLVLLDKGRLVEMSNASANTLTVPPNADVAIPVSSRVDIVQMGAGQTSIAAGSGVTIRSSGSKLKLTGQYSGATLIKRATNEWVLVGDISA